jgi:hypothetical protein
MQIGPAVTGIVVSLAVATGSARAQTSCVPVLVSPVSNAVMDNGCLDTSDPLVWDFDWSDCPGATSYHLYVFHVGSAYPAVDEYLTASQGQFNCPGCYVADANAQNWTWKVSANFNGAAGPWSEVRSFSVEPLGTDCASSPPPITYAPALRLPAQGATMDNGRRGVGMIGWTFEWYDYPGAISYEVKVTRNGASGPQYFVQGQDGDKSFLWYQCFDCEEKKGTTFAWTVRAKVQTPSGVQWTSWAPARTFVMDAPDDTTATYVRRLGDYKVTVESSAVRGQTHGAQLENAALKNVAEAVQTLGEALSQFPSKPKLTPKAAFAHYLGASNRVTLNFNLSSTCTQGIDPGDVACNAGSLSIGARIVAGGTLDVNHVPIWAAVSGVTTPRILCGTTTTRVAHATAQELLAHELGHNWTGASYNGHGEVFGIGAGGNLEAAKQMACNLTANEEAFRLGIAESQAEYSADAFANWLRGTPFGSTDQPFVDGYMNSALDWCSKQAGDGCGLSPSK